MVKVDYEFIPEYKLQEQKEKQMARGYAGKLLELTQARTLVIGLDNEDKPYILMNESRLSDYFDFKLTEY